MLEKQRLTYLESLGIENYVPRLALPGAAPSRLLSDDALREPTAFSTADIAYQGSADEEPAVADTAGSEDVLTAAPSASRVAELLGEREPDKAEVQAELNVVLDTGKPDIENPVGEQLEQLRFSLNIWRINDDLLVVDSRQPGTALPTEKLLQNILRSMGYSLVQLPTSELLRWPLFNTTQFSNDSLENDEIEARAMVQAYISAQCSKKPVKSLLLLGKSAVRFVLTVDEEIDQFFNRHKGRLITQPQWQASTIIAPSLTDMLQEPMQKRITWQALQMLFNNTES